MITTFAPYRETYLPGGDGTGEVCVGTRYDYGIDVSREDSHRGQSRLCPERSLPTAAYVPGLVSHDLKPETSPYSCDWSGEPHTLVASATFRWGADLFRHGFYWEAHEAWEDLWNLAPPKTATRNVLQGLIQMAAAMLKARIQDWSAYERISERAIAKFKASQELKDGDGYWRIPAALVEQIRAITLRRDPGSQTDLWQIEHIGFERLE